MPLPFRRLEPSFLAGLLDDPLLLIQIRSLGRNLLMDCGQLSHLAKRTLKSIDTVCITHAHMDHFIGFDHWVRNILISPKTYRIYGPPGITDKIGSRLQGYDWNLAEDFFCTLQVHDVYPELVRQTEFPGAKGFQREKTNLIPRQGKTIFVDDQVKIEADVCDHKIPALFFRISEQPMFAVDDEKIAKLGLKKGPWLRTLKRAFYRGELAGDQTRDSDSDFAKMPALPDKNPQQLYAAIRRESPVPSIGYISDVGFTPDNRERILALMKNVTLLVCECTYLQEQMPKARQSYHLCTADLCRLLHELSPDTVLPMHLSKTYLGQSGRLYEELVLPPGCRLIRIPERLTPKPLLPHRKPTASLC